MTVVRNEFEAGAEQPVRPPARAHERRGLPLAQLRPLGRSARCSDIENVPIERLQAFYRHYYQPDNAVLIVAGKFDPERGARRGGEDLRRHPEAGADASARPTPSSRRRTASAA